MSTIPYTEQQKRLAKITAAVLSKPDATIAEIARSTGVSERATSRYIEKLKANGIYKDKKIVSMIQKDLEIINRGQKELIRRLKSKKDREDMKTGDLNAVVQSSRKRKALDDASSNGDSNYEIIFNL